MDKRTINRALRPLGLEIQNQRQAGYSYFTSLRHGHQIGESAFFSYLNSISVSRWVEEARDAIKQHRKNGVPFAYITITKKKQIS